MLLKLFVVLLLSVPAWGQLPNTPSSTCTENNGKACPAWLHKLVGQYPPIDYKEKWNGKPDPFFRLGDGHRFLHPTKVSWAVFLGGHAAMWGATVWAVEKASTSGEKAHSEYPAVAFVTGMDFLIFKTMSPAIGSLPPVYATQHYIRAGLQ